MSSLSSVATSASHPDEELVRLALAREPVAVKALVYRLTPSIQRSVTRLLHRAGLARQGDVAQEVEDLVQEVFISLFARDGETLKRWSPQGSASLESFVGVVAQRAAITILRSRRRNPFQLQPEDPVEFDKKRSNTFDPEGQVTARDGVVQLAQRLRARLSPEGLQMFYSLFVWEDSIAELSKSTGLKPEAIYQWRSRLKKQVLALYEQEV